MTSKRIAAASLVVLLGLGGAVVTATAASAEGEASTDTTAAPVAPTEEVTSSPDTQPATSSSTPTVDEAPATTSAPPSTASGDTETTEQPPADSATVASPQPPASQQRVSPASIPTADPYVLAIWEMLPNGDKFPQTLIASQVTSSTDVHALDSKATKCGTSYQSDLYANDKITGALITKAILNGGDESWPGGTYQSKFSNTFTTPKCTVTTIAVPDLTVLPPTCDTAGSLPLTAWPAAQNPNGYEGDGFRVYLDKAYTGAGTYKATVQKVGPGFDPKYPAGTKVTGNLLQTLVVLPATGHQSTDRNGACYVPPIIDGQTCKATGPYHESDDNAAVVTDAGVDIRSAGDKKATDFGYLLTGNAQGIAGINWTQKNVTGNGVFARLIFDLSADGGPGYASFSGLGTHIDQATVAGYGSKSVFDGKSLADVGTVYPHNKLIAIMWQTGSSYAKGDGALLTGVTGDCVNANYVKPPVVVVPPTEPPVVVPPVTDTPTPTPSVTPTEVPTASVQRLASTGVDGTYLILGAGGLFIIVMGLIAIAITLGQRRLRRHDEHMAAIEAGDIDPLA